MLEKSMTHEIRADYQTQYLFPRSLEEWIDPEHPARYVREFVDALDLTEMGLSEEQQARDRDLQGRPHYGVDLLLKVWLYGYMNRIRSSRALERGCRDLLPLVWLAGTHIPDHNTLWRFWSRYREVIRHLFLQSVKVAIRENLVGLVLYAVDGTKIRSAASKRSGWHEADLQKALTQLEAEIQDLEEQIAQAESDDRGGPDDRLPKELEKRETLRERIRSALDSLDTAERDHMHPLDPEARVMVSGSGRTAFAYNAQAVVDQQNGIIVAEGVTTEENDQHQLVPMLEKTKANTGFAQITVADSGYSTAEGLGAAEELGADVVVASKEKKHQRGPYHSHNFSYDKPSDSVTCPQGQTLVREGTRRHKDKPYPMKTYRCKVFRTCPVASRCSDDARGRVIEISPYHDAVVRNRDHPNARALLTARHAVVERAFAEIKETLGFRRWTIKGLEAVRTQWSFVCAAMNLRRLIAARS